ncbi:MAG: 1,6-anhydro-N-acetylmuramyl-L-alanine amidase AmpD [Gammaproteobacteria bacterium]|jgi:AmpD protein
MVKRTIQAGWLQGVRRVPSPNADERPAGMEPELIVIHGISLPPGRFGENWIDDLFTNRLDADADPYFAEIVGLRVSSHALIRRDGELVQYVPFHRRAWHAGKSCWRGRECCNDFSVGIELEGCDDLAYTEAQYSALAWLTGELLLHYERLSVDNIAGHSDISPGRKTDPGPAFQWQRFHDLLGEQVGTPRRTQRGQSE